MTTVPRPTERPALSQAQSGATKLLVAARRDHAEATRALAQANYDRRLMILLALETGLTPAYIGKVLDVSRQRVEQIAASTPDAG